MSCSSYGKNKDVRMGKIKMSPLFKYTYTQFKANSKPFSQSGARVKCDKINVYKWN